MQALPTTPKRELLGQMLTYSRALPRQFNHPLPVMMAHLTPSPPADFSVLPEEVKMTADDIRQLADAVAAWHIRSPLGICLRRSLLRYHFLRRVGIPVRINFGARLKNHQEGGGLGGHAWLTLNDRPYYENPADYAGFVVMYSYPVEEL